MSKSLAQKRLELAIKQAWRCFYCRKVMVSPGFFYPLDGGSLSKKNLRRRRCTVDHLVPRSMGGTDALTNLVAACCKCNSDKGSNPMVAASYG